MLKILKNKSFVAFFTGVFLALGFTYWWLALIAFSLFAWLVLESEKPLKYGFLFGLGFFGAGIHWVYLSLYNYGGANLIFAVSANVMLVLLLVLYPVLAVYFLQRFTTARSIQRALLFPLLWTISELIRAYVLSGFPWLSIGYSQLQSPFNGLAPLGGVWLLGFGFTLLATLSALFYIRRSPKILFSIFCLVSIGYLAKFIPFTEPTGDKFSVALIQGNVEQSTKFKPKKMQQNLRKYLDLARKQQEKVIILPETAITFFETTIVDILMFVDKEFEQRGQSLLTGIPTGDLDENIYYNSVIALGAASGRYHKHHLLPFGEYLPARNFLSFFRDYVYIPLGDFSRGEKNQAPLLTNNVPAGLSICFEGAFGRGIINALPTAQYLINVSNDGWFKGSIAYDQHLLMNQMRALETGREIARATNTGLTAIIAADGTLKAILERDIEGVLTGEIQPRTGLTPYAHFGNGIIFSLLTVYLLLILYCFFNIRLTKNVVVFGLIFVKLFKKEKL